MRVIVNFINVVLVVAVSSGALIFTGLGKTILINLIGSMLVVNRLVVQYISAACTRKKIDRLG
jgi:hypothetical protein